VVTVRFTLTRSEAFSYHRRLLARQRRHWNYVVLGIAIAVVGVALSSFGVIVFGVLYAVLTVAGLWFLTPRLMWRRYPAVRAEQVVSVSDSGVVTQLSHASITADWAFWPRVSGIGDGYVLQGRRRGYIVIPRRAFDSPDDERRFRELAHDHTGATF
jgi:hypothetical protein